VTDGPKSDDVDEDFRPFRDLATAGLAFQDHREHQYPGPQIKEDAQRQCEFAAISRGGMGSMRNQYKYPSVSLVLDHDAHIPKAALYNLDRYARVPFDNDAFLDMVSAWGRYETYENDNDLWSEELAEFRAMGDAIEGYRSHTYELDMGWVQLDWTAMDWLVTRDVPKAVLYMHLSKGTRDTITNLMAFRDMAAAADGHCAYDPPPWFPRFLELPAEIREIAIHEYLLLECQSGRLSKHCHYDKFGSQCCVWDYPEVLIACDNQNASTFPPPETARAPCRWLPTLAFTNKAMLGEVVVLMLRRTARIDLKYIETVPNFKIATWLRKFIDAIPFRDGTRAVQYLNFPHMHWYNSVQPLALTNPACELMAACTNLRKVDMVFHVSKLRKTDGSPCTADELVDFYQFMPILDCVNLEELHFDGIHNRPSYGGSPADLDALEELGKWFKKRFLVRRNQKVEVALVRRWGAWKGRQPGTIIALDEADMKEVAWDLKSVKGEVPGPADVRARCAYPPIV